MSNVLVYTLDEKIYINLTNRCTNNCIFCLRKDKDDVVGQRLWLDNENSTAKDVIEQFEKVYEKTPSQEVIFCGYGEPMLKFDVLKDVAKYIKDKSGKTFGEHVANIRMKKAKSLLKNGNMTVENIAFAVGYQNVEHFNRLFKKTFDMTPVQYRNTSRGK